MLRELNLQEALNCQMTSQYEMYIPLIDGDVEKNIHSRLTLTLIIFNFLNDKVYIHLLKKPNRAWLT